MQLRQPRRDAAEHRERILHTAVALFKEHGVDTVSMHQIAKSAGVGQGTLYRRYASKGELCIDLMNESFIQFQVQIKAIVQDRPAVSPADRLREIISVCIDFLEDKSGYLGAVQSSQCEDGRPLMYRSAPYLFIQEQIQQLLLEHKEQHPASAVDPEFTSHAFLAVICPELYMEFRYSQGRTTEDIKRHVEQLLVDPLVR
ncbi:TetR/AcrR family transcriptional regulator [Paenibacillus gansuensis]|uniref:TetR/AcrR family transcriptional regulator n=1 Tax=Paenibacillus gansuensis TaxID=306542 RepID=A0ABW5PLF7_9BACL